MAGITIFRGVNKKKTFAISQKINEDCTNERESSERGPVWVAVREPPTLVNEEKLALLEDVIRGFVGTLIDRGDLKASQIR